MASLPDGRQSANIVANKTLALTDSGVIQNIQADGITITLPATVVGSYYVVRNGGVPPTNGPVGAVSDQAVLVTIAPNASDKIAGNGFTATDNKAALNTKATARVGDEIHLVGDGVDGWMVSRVIGTWARQA